MRNETAPHGYTRGYGCATFWLRATYVYTAAAYATIWFTHTLTTPLCYIYPHSHVTFTHGLLWLLYGYLHLRWVVRAHNPFIYLCCTGWITVAALTYTPCLFTQFPHTTHTHTHTLGYFGLLHTFGYTFAVPLHFTPHLPFFLPWVSPSTHTPLHTHWLLRCVRLAHWRTRAPTHTAGRDTLHTTYFTSLLHTAHLPIHTFLLRYYCVAFCRLSIYRGRSAAARLRTAHAAHPLLRTHAPRYTHLVLLPHWYLPAYHCRTFTHTRTPAHTHTHLSLSSVTTYTHHYATHTHTCLRYTLVNAPYSYTHALYLPFTGFVFIYAAVINSAHARCWSPPCSPHRYHYLSHTRKHTTRRARRVRFGFSAFAYACWLFATCDAHHTHYHLLHALLPHPYRHPPPGTCW